MSMINLSEVRETIARFGDKNSVDREIKALYNQAKALARIYKVDLE